jgi:esterase/lipase
MIASTASLPAHSYAEAIDRAHAFMALDDDARVLPEAHTLLLESGKPTPLAVVLFHGFTNNPAQYATFAPLLHQCGVNVFVPRMPEHGFRDRMTTSIANLTAETLLASANNALDIACGLGERVGVVGISMGGSLAAYFAQFRAIDIAVPVAPDFSLLQLPYPVSHAIAWMGLRIPNLFLWWDPVTREKQRPLTAYPRFSTHALFQTMRIGDDVYEMSRTRRQLATKTVTVVNHADPAVNNEVTQQVCANWQTWKPANAEYLELRSLPENHDIIDPANPLARTDKVYPKLLAALGITSS